MPPGLFVCSLYSALCVQPITQLFGTNSDMITLFVTTLVFLQNEYMCLFPVHWYYKWKWNLASSILFLVLIVLTYQHWGMVTLWSLSWPRTCWYQADAFDWVLIVKPLETQGSYQTYCEKVDGQRFSTFQMPIWPSQLLIQQTFRYQKKKYQP